MTVQVAYQTARLKRADLSRQNVPFHEFVLSRDASLLNSQLQNASKIVELHPLTLEDCRKGKQRSKFEIYPEYLFVVLHYFEPTSNAIAELHVVLTHESLIFLANRPAPEGQNWYHLLNLEPELTLEQCIHNIFDVCIDSALARAANITDLIYEAETLILAEKFSPEIIIKLKRNASHFKRSVNAVFPVLKELLELLELNEDSQLMFRNILDHQERLREETETIHTEVLALFDTYWGAMSTSTNNQLKRLTIMATIVFPLAFWTSFFGMNFEFLPFKETWFLGLALALMSGSVLAVFIYLKRQGLIRGGLRLNKVVQQKFK
ncbi:MAG: cobalt/magnesium transport protein CorA, partial [Pseudomonadota bacterium]|jgi:magnesium transporter